MQTECSADLFGFTPVEGRKVVAAFDGGTMTSEAGAMLLGATDKHIRLIERFADLLAVNSDSSATLVCEDGNYITVYSKAIPFTDLHVQQISRSQYPESIHRLRTLVSARAGIGHHFHRRRKICGGGR
jgi:hypothetical protein